MSKTDLESSGVIPGASNPSPQQERLSLQSGRSSLAKHGGAYFSAVYGFMKDPIAAPGPYENQEC